MKKRIHFTRKTILIASALIALVLGGSAFAFIRQRQGNDTESRDEQSQDDLEANDIDFGPPTKDEKSSGDEQKKQIVGQEDQERPSEANVVISDASQYGDNIEVRAFVTNVIADGTCTFIFNKDSESFRHQTKAVADASTSICQPLTIARSKFSSSGTWTVKVKYDSATLSGQAEHKVEVK